MRTIARHLRNATVVIALTGAALLVGTAPAQAATPVARTTAGTVHPASSWIGTCYASRGSTFGGGWCDGNGPNWTYSGTVKCSNNVWYEGINRWAGDRRGSYAECPSGTHSLSGTGGLDYFYNGVYQGSVLV